MNISGLIDRTLLKFHKYGNYASYELTPIGQDRVAAGRVILKLREQRYKNEKKSI